MKDKICENCKSFDSEFEMCVRNKRAIDVDFDDTCEDFLQKKKKEK